ncbi:MAG: hypothetical protein E6J34_01335 [Chloroflexi bacterium]|nr:MAG: hypothetical protein E6J34_01335 [Chloroflexota bacterium]
MPTKNPALFYGALAVAVIGLILCIWYLVPGVYHPLASGNVMAGHFKHAAVFGALAVIGVIGALVTRPKAAMK